MTRWAVAIVVGVFAFWFVCGCGEDAKQAAAAKKIHGPVKGGQTGQKGSPNNPGAGTSE